MLLLNGNQIVTIIFAKISPMYKRSILLILALSVSCRSEKRNLAYDAGDSESTQVTQTPTFTQPDWSKNAVMYEVNTRQFSEDGSFSAVQDQLPRLKDMGIDILWFMPIHPISVEKRKAEGDLLVTEIEDPEEQKKYLGSYYAVADFKEVNPEHGTLDDFKSLVNEAHELSMKVIIDWVPNHTGWDHSWITEHPEWYTQNDKGEIVDPLNPETGESWGWTDVADLNYDVAEMREEMISDMKYWLTEANIDGFRCDVAHGVPVDFWRDANAQLRETKNDIYMLAEAEIPALAEMFNSSYAWSFHHTLKEALHGEKELDELEATVKSYKERFGKDHHMLMFTTNHDENAWSGTVFERYGDAHKAMAVLTFTLDGMPLVYSGQESGMDKRLKFFEKDVIEWGDYALQDFYKNLLALKKGNKALYNGSFGGDLEVIDSGNPKVYTYQREKEGNKVFVAINFSDKEQSFDWPLNGNDSWNLEFGEVLPENKGLGKYGYAVWVKNE